MPKFCAQYSRDVGEPLAGTGAHPRSNLLLSWPIGSWTRTFHQAKNMTETVSEQVKKLVASGRRINLIHRPDQPMGWHRAYLMPEQQVYDIRHDEVGDFLSALQQGQSLVAWHSGKVRHKVVLCCTHGVKDKCCAKFGNASFKALDAAAGQWGGAFEIWQSTHLGGCRLASAALVFPNMHKYGRINVEQAGLLLDSESRNQPYLPCYRGDGVLSPVQQIADIEARKSLALEGTYPTRLSIQARPTLSEDEACFDIHWHNDVDEGRLTVQLQSATVARFDTCADMDDGEAPVDRQIWSPERVQTVP